MISGNIHLSSDLRRLAFIRLLVWLSAPRTRTSRDVLIKRYRKAIKEHRKNYKWNRDPRSGRTVAGVGMGINSREAGTRAHKRVRTIGRDVIAFNHLTLGQNLQFFRKGECSWGKNGYILASLSSGEDGKPFFYNEKRLEEELQREGFLAVLGKGEQLIFSTALIELDVDRILPLLSMLENNVTIGNIESRFLYSVDKWLEKKTESEANSLKRNRIRIERKSISEKISRLEEEKKQKEVTSHIKRSGPSVQIYCREQISPRLHFLQDLGYIEKSRQGVHLTKRGSLLKKALIDPLHEQSETENASLVALRDERSLLETIVDLDTKDLPPLDFENFETYFSIVARFYKRSGAILLNYFNTFKSIASRAVDASEALTLEHFENCLLRLSEQREMTISTAGRGTKYIRIRGGF